MKLAAKANYDHSEFRDDYLRNLPPMTETNPNLHGHLTITIGELAWLKTSFPPENTKMRVKFWGQEGVGRVAVAKNAAPEMHNFYTTTILYDIRCPALLFQKYLRDMVRLRVEVLDKRNDKVVGNVLVNMLLFLKENPKAGNSPIEDIKGLFPIYKIQTSCVKPEAAEKIGEIELDMNVRFLKFPVLQIVASQQPNSARSHRKLTCIYRTIHTIISCDITAAIVTDPTKQHLDSSFLMNEMKSQTGRGGTEQSDYATQQQINSPRTRSRTKILEAQNLLQRDQQLVAQGIEGDNQAQQQQKKVAIQEEDFEGDNVKLQRMLSEKQNDQYLKLMKKQAEKDQIEASMYWKDKPLLVPELELLRLRMDEAELVSGLSAGVYADLVSVPENLPEKENLDLKNVSGYAVNVDTFVLTNSALKKRLAKTQLFLTVQVPVFETINGNEIKVFYDQLFVSCRRQPGIQESSRFEFNQSFPCKLSIDESSISLFTESRVYFILQIGGDDASSRVEFAKGEFKFDQLLLKPFLRGSFDVPLFLVGGFNSNNAGAATSDAAGGRSKSTGKVVSGGGAQPKKQQQQAAPAGELNISVALLNIMTQFLPYMAPIKRGDGAANHGRSKDHNNGTVKRGNQAAGTSIVDNGKIGGNIPFQIILEVKEINNFTQIANSLADLIVIRHKVYGCSDNMQGMSRGYDSTNKVYLVDYKAVIPVDESSLVKMRSLPFILEIWQRKNGKESFLGMVRVNLKTLPELITNVHAFASNLYPTMLIEGEIGVWDPQTNENVATTNMAFAFGTVQQVQRYEQKETRTNQEKVLAMATATATMNFQTGKKSEVPQQGTSSFQPKNSKNIVTLVKGENASVKSQQNAFVIRNNNNAAVGGGGGIQENVSEVQSEAENKSTSSLGPSIVIPKFKKIRFTEMEYSKEVITKVFVIVMENIRRNKRRAQNILRNFIVKAEKNERRVTLREFYNFLNDIPVQEVLHIKNGYLHKLISVLDFEGAGEIATPDFIRSYNSFLNYEDILRDSYSHAVKQFALMLASKQYSITDFERILLRWSDFGFIKREVLKKILEQDLECDDPVLVKKLLDLLDVQEDGLIQANLLPDYLRGTEVYDKLNYIHADSSKYAELVRENLQEILAKNEEGVKELIMNEELADKVMHVRDIQYLIEGLGLEISFWESLCIIDSIRKSLNVPVVDPIDEFTLPFVYLTDWLAYVMKQRRDDPQQFNYFTYLVEQRSRIQEEHFIAENRKKGAQSIIDEQKDEYDDADDRNENRNNNNNNIMEYDYEGDRQHEREGDDDDEEEDDDDLINLVKNNYKKN